MMWLFQNAAVATMVALAVAAVSNRVRLSPSLRYGVWLIVVLKFVAPPVVSWTWPGEVVQRTTTRVGAALERTVTPPSPGDESTRVASEAAARLGVGSQASPTEVLSWLLRVAWLAGALGLAAVYLGRHRFLRHLTARPGVIPDPVERAVRDGAARMGVRPPRIVVADIEGPALVGTLRPFLLWPRTLHVVLDPDQLRGVVAHELAHLRRHDHVRGWFEMAIAIVWWWYPVFWFARRRMREAAEQACDAWAVRMMAGGSRRYADTLLQLAERRIVTGRPIPFAAHAIVAEHPMRRRLEEIMRQRPSVPARRSILVAGLLALFVFPAWRTADPAPPMTRADADAFAGVYARGDVTLAAGGTLPVRVGPDSWFFAFEYAPDGTATLRYEAVRVGGGTIQTFVVLDGRRARSGDLVASRVRRVVSDVGFTTSRDADGVMSGAAVPSGFHHNVRGCGHTIGAWTHGALGAPNDAGGYFANRGFVGVFIHQAARGTAVRYYEVLGGDGRTARVTLSRDGVPGDVNPDERSLLDELAACVGYSMRVEAEAERRPARRRGTGRDRPRGS